MSGVRMSGLVSGLDTESLVTQLSDAYKTKVDNVKKDKTIVQWKKEAWAALNTKIMDFYKGALSTFRSVSTYNTKAVAGDLKGMKITAGATAANGSHNIQITNTARAQMWTGKNIGNTSFNETSYTNADTSMKLSDLKDSDGHNIGASLSGASFKVGTGDSAVEITVNVGTDATVQDAIDNINSQLEGNGIGLKASFADGKFTLTNESAIAETTTDADGKEVTTYSGGEDIIVSTSDELSSKIFGFSATDTEATLKSKAAGDKDNSVTGTEGFYKENVAASSKVAAATKLKDLGIAEGTVLKVNGTEITVTASMTMSQLATSMSNVGINASYDENQGRFYLSSKTTGIANAFTLEADDDTLAKLGLDLADGDTGKIAAQDASLIYNGVEYTQATNTFSINGLSITATEVGAEQTFNVDNDISGIYDKIKEFTTKYNELITEMNTLFSADRVKDYEPLTDEEKSAMSDEQIEKWESVIKKSVLRRDSTISSLLSSMRTVLNKQVGVTEADGTTKNYSLASFGINTGLYAEKGALHIDGNSDDPDYADKDDKLKAALAANPNAVAKTFSSLGTEMYNSLMKAMGKTELSSALTFYNDKQIDDELDDYDDKIDTLQDKLTAAEDKYYKQFAAMETAMSKLQSQQSYITQLFGS